MMTTTTADKRQISIRKAMCTLFGITTHIQYLYDYDLHGCPPVCTVSIGQQYTIW